MADNHAVIESIRSQIFDDLSSYLPSGPYALLDFPAHSNVGDSAIWLGEIAYFNQSLGRLPNYVCSFSNFSKDELRQRVPRGTIFLHGGGNFGDLWDWHHNFREDILREMNGYRIIQLPQTVHFKSTERLDRTARLIEEHGDFVLLVRDKPSLEIAKSKFQCETHLVPDMAFCLGELKPGSASIDVMALMRTDLEKADYGLPSNPTIANEDWLDEQLIDVRVSKVKSVLKDLASADWKNIELGKSNAAASIRLQRGLKQLSSGRVVITDRLHAHILSTLLSRPHAVLDNNYGKIGRFMDAFSGVSPVAHRFESAEPAVAWALEEAARLRPLH